MSNLKMIAPMPICMPLHTQELRRMHHAMCHHPQAKSLLQTEKEHTSRWKCVAKVKILTTFAAHGASNERMQE
jgi:hypothetical protein